MITCTACTNDDLIAALNNAFTLNATTMEMIHRWAIYTSVVSGLLVFFAVCTVGLLYANARARR